MKCQFCGSEKITFYRQMRSDYVWVVTARCDNMHIPNMKKIFYPVANFDLKTLSDLPKKESVKAQPQMTMLEQILDDAKKEYPVKQPYKNFPFPASKK